jgi:hypothetical protein
LQIVDCRGCSNDSGAISAGASDPDDREKEEH